MHRWGWQSPRLTCFAAGRWVTSFPGCLCTWGQGGREHLAKQQHQITPWPTHGLLHPSASWGPARGCGVQGDGLQSFSYLHSKISSGWIPELPGMCSERAHAGWEYHSCFPTRSSLGPGSFWALFQNQHCTLISSLVCFYQTRQISGWDSVRTHYSTLVKSSIFLTSSGQRSTAPLCMLFSMFSGFTSSQNGHKIWNAKKGKTNSFVI